MRLAKRWGDPVTLIADAELLYPETALAIAILETGGFTAKGLMKSHNWFAFRPNGRGFARRERKGYGVYSTPEAMIADYKQWETEVCIRHGLNTENQFRGWVNRHYATDPLYSVKLQQSINLVRR